MEANPPQGAFLHHFNNPSLPPIPKCLLKATKAGRYEDLGDLLPEALAEAFDTQLSKKARRISPLRKPLPLILPLTGA